MDDIDYIRRYLSDVTIEDSVDISPIYTVQDTEYLDYLRRFLGDT